MRDLKDVLDKLSEMSPEQIALHFAEHGITGTPRCPAQCAVAEYVKKECSAGWVSVGPTEVDMLHEDVELGDTNAVDDAWADRPRTTNPRSVQEFIKMFDQHEFPGLER